MRKLGIVLGVVLALAAAASAQNLVVNGDFETGNFNGWTQFGDTGYTSISTLAAHDGTYGLRTGPSTPGGIQQTLPLLAGQQAEIEFWYAVSSTSTPNSFSADFGGVNLVSLADYTNTSWVEFSQVVTVPADNPVLSFTFTNPPAYWNLDSVVVTPEPAALVLLGLAGLVLRRR